MKKIIMLTKTGSLPRNEIQSKARVQSIQPPLENEQNQPVEVAPLEVPPPPLQQRPTKNAPTAIISPLRFPVNFRSFYKDSGFLEN